MLDFMLKSKKMVYLIWPNLSLRQQVPAILSLLLVTVLTFFLYVQVKSREAHRISHEFDLYSETCIQSLLVKFKEVSLELRDVARSFAYSSGPSVSDFRHDYAKIAQGHFAGRAEPMQMFYVDSKGELAYLEPGPFTLPDDGGVNLQNAGAFIQAGAAALGVGGELVDKKAVKVKRFSVITENTRTYLKAVREARTT